MIIAAVIPIAYQEYQKHPRSESETPIFCELTGEESNIPSGSTHEITVQPNQFIIWSSGDICVGYDDEEQNCVQSYPDNGFVSVFHPLNNQETSYSLSQLVATYNWYGIYSNCNSQEEQVRIQQSAFNLSQPGHCNGDGCETIYIRIFEGGQFTATLYVP